MWYFEIPPARVRDNSYPKPFCKIQRPLVTKKSLERRAALSPLLLEGISLGAWCCVAIDGGTSLNKSQINLLISASLESEMKQ